MIPGIRNRTGRDFRGHTGKYKQNNKKEGKRNYALFVCYLGTFPRVSCQNSSIRSVKPFPVETGDTIGVVAPASAPPDMAGFREGIAQLERRGYRVELGRSTFAEHGYLSGTDAERLDELNGFLRRDDIKMLIAVRGGYGCLRLLPHLDYEAARAHPKLLVGYSDVTALHLALWRHAGLPGISGPMIAVDWPDPDPASEALFWAIARGETCESLVGPAGETLQPLRAGTAEGPLLGGNLSTIVRLLGTPYLPSFEQAILFVEDVNEPPYRIDAMLAQLRLAGAFDKLGGLVLGSFTRSQPEPDKPCKSPSPGEIFREYFSEAGFPVAEGLVYGHFPVKNSLPIGGRARLQVTSDMAQLGLVESIVSPPL